MKTNNYFFVVGIVGAIIAGGYSLGQVVDIGSFEVLPEAEAHVGIEGAVGTYWKYVYASISPDYNKWISVRCNSGDMLTGWADYHSNVLEVSWGLPYRSSNVDGWGNNYYNPGSSTQYAYLFIFCSPR